MAIPIRQLESLTSYVANGTDTVWNFSFASGYLDAAHVKAYTISPTGVRADLVVIPAAIIGGAQLSVVPAILSGYELTIYRDTPTAAPLVDFADRAAFTEASLDTSTKQAIFSAAETSDALGVATERLTDVSTYVDNALTYKNDAAASATAAASSATSAASSATAASGSATSAAASAAEALATIGALALSTGASLVGWIQAGTGAVLRTVLLKLRETVTPYDFGAVGNNVADDYAALQAWATYCAGNKKRADFADGEYFTSNTIVFNGVGGSTLSLNGRGRRSIIRMAATDRPAIEINLTGEQYYSGNFDFHIIGPSNPGNVASCGVLLSGDAALTGRMDWSRLMIRGFYSGLKFTKPAVGPEGSVAWVGFEGLTLVNQEMHNIWFTAGSSTGNTFIGGRYITNASDSVHIQFDGAAQNVGDLIFNGIHAGAGDTPLGSSLVGFGADTTYRSQVSIVSCQFDAHCNRIIKQSAVGASQYANFVMLGNNHGGAVDHATYMQPMSRTIFDDRHVSRWEAGIYKATNATGAQTLDCFELTLGAFGAAWVTVAAYGVVSGVPSVSSEYRFHVRVNGSGVTVGVLAESSQQDSAQLAWTYTDLGSSKGKLTLAFSPTGTGTIVESTVSARGHKFMVRRMELN